MNLWFNHFVFEYICNYGQITDRGNNIIFRAIQTAVRGSISLLLLLNMLQARLYSFSGQRSGNSPCYGPNLQSRVAAISNVQRCKPAGRLRKMRFSDDDALAIWIAFSLMTRPAIYVIHEALAPLFF